MADGCHIENRLLAIHPRFIVRLTWNFVWRSRITFRHRPRDLNTKFWKFKMADGRHLENGFIAISRPGIIRFWWDLVCTLKFWFKDGHMLIYKKLWNSKCRTAAILKIVFWLYLHVLLSDWRGIWHVKVEPCWDTCHMTKIAIFVNSRWRTAAILKMVSSLSRGSSDFNEIWCAIADFGSKDGHVTKCQNFAISKWRTAAILKIVFGYISTVYCPINVKFDRKKQNYVQILVTWPKYQNLKIQDGGQQPFWKWFHHYISAADHPISMKFGVPLHSLVSRTVNY